MVTVSCALPKWLHDKIVARAEQRGASVSKVMRGACFDKFAGPVAKDDQPDTCAEEAPSG